MCVRYIILSKLEHIGRNIIAVSKQKFYKSFGLPTFFNQSQNIRIHRFCLFKLFFLPRRIRHFDVFENFEFKRLFQFFHSSLENLVTFCTLKTATTQGLQIFEWVGASKGRLIPVTSQFKTWAPFQPKINLPK